MQILNLYVQSPTMTESYYMRRTSLLDRLACRAVARLCSICKTYVQKIVETWAPTTEVEHPRVFIDTYSSAYWQLPLRMYRHIRHLYDPPVHTAIYWIEMYMMRREWKPLSKAASLKRRVGYTRTVTRVLSSHYPTSLGRLFLWPIVVCALSSGVPRIPSVCLGVL